MTEPDRIGCGANHGGCGCMGLWDCAHDDKLQRATETIAHLANYGMGCSGSQGGQEIPCARICQCRSEAISVLRAVYAKELERDAVDRQETSRAWDAHLAAGGSEPDHD